jgi:hypothetical protein
MIKLPHTLVRIAAASALALGLSGLSAISSQAQDRDSPLPGYWQYSYHVSIIPAGDQMKCLSKAEVTRFFDGLCNKGSTCTYSVNDAHDGKVRLEGLWIDHKGRHTKVKADGVYEPRSFKLNAHIVLNIGLPVSGTIEGKYISDTCPPGSENPKKK